MDPLFTPPPAAQPRPTSPRGPSAGCVTRPCEKRPRNMTLPELRVAVQNEQFRTSALAKRNGKLSNRCHTLEESGQVLEAANRALEEKRRALEERIRALEELVRTLKENNRTLVADNQLFVYALNGPHGRTGCQTYTRELNKVMATD